MSTTTVLLWHGFMRSPRDLSPMVKTLTSDGCCVFTPKAWGPVAMNSAATARKAARALLQSDDWSEAPVVIVTHSAGAALGAWTALALPPAMLRGLVLADGTDNLVRGFTRCLPRLRGVPIHLIDADPGPCNRFGALSLHVRQTHDRVTCVRVAGAGHGDIERDVGSEQGPSALYARVCGDRSSPAVAARFQAAVLAAVHELGD